VVVFSIVASTLPFPPSHQVLPFAAELDVVDVVVWIALDRFRSLQLVSLRWNWGETKSSKDRMEGCGDEMLELRESWVGKV
jgi:hypothetical protein